MKRLLRESWRALILLVGLVPSTEARAANAALESPPEVIELKEIYVRFQVRVLGLARVTGRFDRLRGELTSAADADGLAVRMRIDVDSVTTDDAWRDEYLRGPAFFKAERYPHISFSGSCLSYGRAGSARIVGDLSLHGKTKRVVFEVQALDVPETGRAAGYQATATIRRSEFGLTALRHIVADEVDIIVALNTVAGE